MTSAAIVNAAYRIKLSQQSVVVEAFLHYGGLSKVIAAASQTEKSLLGRYSISVINFFFCCPGRQEEVKDLRVSCQRCSRALV